MKNIPVFFRPVFFYILIASYFFLSLSQLENYDIWLHLKGGEWIINNLAVPRTQFFSYAVGKASWVNHSWFFQVLIFLVYKFLGGINALILFRAIIVTLTLLIALRPFLKKVYFPVFLFASWLLSSLFLTRTPIRPELLSAFFLAVYLYILFNKKNPWFLVLIQSFWVNIHGYSMLGPILLFLFILSEFIKRKIKLPFDWNNVRYLDDKRTYNKILSILAVTVVLFFLSPYGIDNFKYPFFVIRSFLYSSNNFYHISELSSSSLPGILFTQKYILLICALTLFMTSLLLNIRKVNIFNVWVFISFFLMYCAANRHGGFFAITACFCVLDNFKTENLTYLKKYFKFRYAGILSIILTILLGFYIARDQFFKVSELNKRYIYSKGFVSKSHLFGVSGSRYPKKAVDFIIEHKIKGPIFNCFNIGGYLIWRLYPTHRVFIDGRVGGVYKGIYRKEFMDEFVWSLNDFKKWKELDEKYGFNMVVLDYSSTDFYYYLIKNLYNAEKWRLVYMGDVAVVFVKDNSINKDIISSYDILFEDIEKGEEEDYLVEKKETPIYPEYFLNKARFFIEAMDMTGPALKNLEIAELIDPECYEIYQLRGYTYFKMKRFKEAEEAFMKSLQIDPDIAEPYLNLGSVAAEMGLYKKAYFLYKEALYLDKDNKVARDNLSKLPRQAFD
ncbi:tetratricopeptide repeat protein [Candidatus Omnitrophota bacterium]